MTSIPHLAGTPGDKITADYLKLEWEAQNMDSVQMIDYDVLLDFPDDVKFNKYWWIFLNRRDNYRKSLKYL